MPLNAATYAEELAMKAGKPHSGMKGRGGRSRRGWKGFYGSVHDIVRIYRFFWLPMGGERSGELLHEPLKEAYCSSCHAGTGATWGS